VAAAVLSAAGLARRVDAAPPIAWVPVVPGSTLADALARVPQAAPPGEATRATIYAARGETQGFAVVVRAPAEADLTRLEVTATALACSSGPCTGKSIPADRVDAYRAIYQRVDYASGDGDQTRPGRTHAKGPPGSGTLADPGNGSLCSKGFFGRPCLIPDGLVPFRRCSDRTAPPCNAGDAGAPNRCAVDGAGCGAGAPSMTVPAGSNQELWIEVRVPRGAERAPAGTYSGSIAVTTNAGTATVPIDLVAWDFEVPISPSFRTAFGNNATSEPRAAYDVEIQELLAKHRVSTTRYGSGTAKTWPQRDYGAVVRRLRGRWGVPNALEVGWSFGVSQGKCVPANSVEYATTSALTSWIREHRLPTSGVLLYAHNGDEIWSTAEHQGPCGGSTYAYLRAAARQVHAVRDAPVSLLSTVNPNPALEPVSGPAGERRVVDIFAVQPFFMFLEPESVARVRSSGSEIWWYAIWLGDAYSPKWQLDYSPVSYRSGFIAESMGISGALISEYWTRTVPGHDNPWASGTALLGNVCDGKVPGAARPNCRTNGDSQFIYTGAQVGGFRAVPHLRLKFFRDGIQDYELLQIAKRLPSWKTDCRSAAFPGETCDAIVRRLGGSDWSDYSTDTRLLQLARVAIGERIAADPGRPRGEAGRAASSDRGGERKGP
jgi:hypothetical protein